MNTSTSTSAMRLKASGETAIGYFVSARTRDEIRALLSEGTDPFYGTTALTAYVDLDAEARYAGRPRLHR